MNGERTEEREFGVQRLDALMKSWHLDNHDLVEAGGEKEQLTHKQVQRARSGRRLTLRMMQKVARALNAAIARRVELPKGEQFDAYLHRELFSYAKGYDPAWRDSNTRYYPKT